VAEGQVTEKVSEALEQAYYGPLKEEEEKEKSFLEALINFIKSRREALKPKLEQAVS
jgi:hypothetical protein